MKTHFWISIPFVIFLSSCDSASSPTAQSQLGVILHVEPSVLKLDTAGYLLTISFQNNSNDDIYLSLANGRPFYYLQLWANDSLWIYTSSVPITDIRDVYRFSTSRVKPDSAYLDNLILHLGAGLYRLEARVDVAGDSLWSETVNSNQIRVAP